MKYKFYKIKSKKYNFGSWWAYVVDSKESLEHILKTKSSHIVGEYFKAKETLSKQNGHITREMSALAMACENGNSQSLLDDCRIMDDVYLKPIVEMYISGKTLLFNYNGGYCFLYDDLEITDTVESDIYKFPQTRYTKEDIRVSQWANGVHWYAKVGKDDVLDNRGRQKWDSYDKAYSAAVEYIKGTQK